jgi:hypothetical protein
MGVSPAAFEPTGQNLMAVTAACQSEGHIVLSHAPGEFLKFFPPQLQRPFFGQNETPVKFVQPLRSLRENPLHKSVRALARFPAEFTRKDQNPVSERLFRAGATVLQLIEEALPGTNHDLRSSGRRGRAVVCYKVRDCEVCFVTDSRDDGNGRGTDRPCDGLFIEAP